MKRVTLILERKGREVATISPEATVLDAAHQMNDMRIGSLMVMNGRQILGIITERDILRRLVAAEKDPSTTRVSEIMTVNPISCTAETSLDECRGIMTTKRIRHLPVIEEGRLLGIITIGDLTAQQIEDHQTTIQYLNDYMEMPPIPSQV